MSRSDRRGSPEVATGIYVYGIVPADVEVEPDAESVAEELLRGNYDEFAAALHALEGHAEFIVKGRYDEDTILREVISESTEAQQLREQMAGMSEDAARNSRMALGEIVVKALD